MFGKNKSKSGKNGNKIENGIVSIDPYTQDSYIYAKNEFNPCSIDKVGKDNFFISYLKYKDLMIGSVEIPGTTEDSDVPDLITIKAYEEFDLDTSKEYRITYSEAQNTGSENKTFNLFVIENPVITKIFNPIAKKTSYIDYIVAAPLMFGALYAKNLMSAQNTDAFIVIQNDDAFLAVYQNGEYVQSRPLRYSIKNMSDKFFSLSEKRVDEYAFMQILRHAEDEKDKECLSQIFDEIAYYLSDILNSISRVYNLKIQNLYIVTDEPFQGFCGSIEGKTGIPTSNFDIKISINTKDTQVSSLNTVMTLFAQNYKDDHNDNFNFSSFLRPPPLFKRHSGKLILYIAAGFLLAFAYPAYQYVYGFIVQQDIDRLTEEYNVAHAQEEQIKAELARIAAEYENTKKILDSENEKIEFRKNLLTEIHEKKANYPMKSVVLYELTKLVSQKDIKVGKVVNNDKNMTIMLLSKDEKQLTEFIKNVSNEIKYSITTQEIVFDKNKPNPTYESNVTVKIK